MADVTLGDRELDVLEALWQHGPGTVAEMQATLDAELAYNTVLTILRNLEAKGVVTHTVEGRFHRYRAVVAEASMRGSILERFVDRLFGGSALTLMTHLVESKQVSSAELRKLHRLIEERMDTGAPGTSSASTPSGKARSPIPPTRRTGERK